MEEGREGVEASTCRSCWLLRFGAVTAATVRPCHSLLPSELLPFWLPLLLSRWQTGSATAHAHALERYCGRKEQQEQQRSMTVSVRKIISKVCPGLPGRDKTGQPLWEADPCWQTQPTSGGPTTKNESK